MPLSCKGIADDGNKGERKGRSYQGAHRSAKSKGDKGSHCDLLLPVECSFPLRRSPRKAMR